MAKRNDIVTTAGNLVRRFSHYSDVALTRPVIVTKNGRPRNILISVEEYQRLKRRNQHAVMAADIPDAFIPQLEVLAQDRGRK